MPQNWYEYVPGIVQKHHEQVHEPALRFLWAMEVPVPIKFIDGRQLKSPTKNINVELEFFLLM